MLPQSAFAAGGPEARAFTILWWVFFAVLAAIFVMVIGSLAAAVMRRHRRLEQELLEQRQRPPAATEHKLTVRVTIASAVSVVILFAFIVASVATGNVISRAAPAMTIEVMGNQWWWYVQYDNDDPSRIVVTANEIHIPTGKQIALRLRSLDVIHSFWVPGLNGKRDLIPSRINTQWIEADQPGKFRGQCAEFCGFGHARMAMWVVAQPEAEFNRWYERQSAPAAPPSADPAQRGQKVFLDHACAMCHTIQGTPAAGTVGPDLTHFASRLAIAAGTLPNNRGNLAGWIADPQNIKPGNHMATIPLRSDELQALLDYLETLQ